jgi:hypothetical protein
LYGNDFSSTGGESSSFLKLDFNSLENHGTESIEQNEPVSIKKLNENINQNLNVIQQMKNSIQAKNNFIDNKLDTIREDENFLMNANKERDIYINKIEEKVFYKFKDRFDFNYQYSLAKSVLEIFYDRILDIKENESEENLQKSKDNVSSNDGNCGLNQSNTTATLAEISEDKIFNDFKDKVSKFKDFIRKLKDSQNNHNTSSINTEKFRRINKLIEDVKVEAEELLEESEDSAYDYENFFYPILKSIKLLLIILQAKIRIEKALEIVEKVIFIYDIKLHKIIF